MDSQDSPTVIPCSEEMAVESSAEVIPPTPDSSNIEPNSEEVSQSLLADENSSENNDTSLSTRDGPDGKDKSRNVTTGESNFAMDLESSEMNPMSSTRIEQDNSVSMLNEGFMIDSASLSLSAVNDTSRKTLLERTDAADEGEEMESVEIDLEDQEEDQVLEEEVEGEEVGESRASTHKSPTGSDEESEDDSVDYPLPRFPMARVKKIMAICAAAEDDEEEEPSVSKGRKGKEKPSKGNMLINKEAVYLTTLATEHFISVIGELAGNVTTSSKKKTMTLDHLKRALSDTDAFAFLEGCFQPSVIIGD